jgi:methyl-accepting chemotaxis protein
VRKLAERSQVAAQEISSVSTGSVTLAESAGASLERLVPSIRKTADLVQDIASASREQAQGLDQITSAVDQLSQTTQSGAGASEELAATSEGMSSHAQQLRAMVSYFRIGNAASAAPAEPRSAPAKPARASRPHAARKPAFVPVMAAATSTAEAGFVEF